MKHQQALRKSFIILVTGSTLTSVVACGVAATHDQVDANASTATSSNPSQQELMVEEDVDSPYLELPSQHLIGETFNFSLGVNFSGPVKPDPSAFSEELTDGPNTAADVVLIEQENHVNYAFQFSETYDQDCESTAEMACGQGAASAQGNVAAIEILLPKGKLVPDTYPIAAAGNLASGKAISADNIMLYSRQLYSDPAHGQLGCEVWGPGELQISEATYDAAGQLTYLAANLTRLCNQTQPFPAAEPGDIVDNTHREPIEEYEVNIAWQIRLVPAIADAQP